MKKHKPLVYYRNFTAFLFVYVILEDCPRFTALLTHQLEFTKFKEIVIYILIWPLIDSINIEVEYSKDSNLFLKWSRFIWLFRTHLKNCGKADKKLVYYVNIGNYHYYCSRLGHMNVANEETASINLSIIPANYVFLIRISLACFTIDDSAKGGLFLFWELFTMIPCALKYFKR